MLNQLWNHTFSFYMVSIERFIDITVTVDTKYIYDEQIGQALGVYGTRESSIQRTIYLVYSVYNLILTE